MPAPVPVAIAGGATPLGVTAQVQDPPPAGRRGRHRVPGAGRCTVGRAVATERNNHGGASSHSARGILGKQKTPGVPAPEVCHHDATTRGRLPGAGPPGRPPVGGSAARRPPVTGVRKSGWRERFRRLRGRGHRFSAPDVPEAQHRGRGIRAALGIGGSPSVVAPPAVIGRPAEPLPVLDRRDMSRWAGRVFVPAGPGCSPGWTRTNNRPVHSHRRSQAPWSSCRRVVSLVGGGSRSLRGGPSRRFRGVRHDEACGRRVCPLRPAPGDLLGVRPSARRRGSRRDLHRLPLPPVTVTQRFVHNE